MISGPFLSQVSCSSPGNCVIAGNYQADDPSQETRALLADEQAGVWGQAAPISGQAVAVLAVSCPPTAGDCAAGGVSKFSPIHGDVGAFVVSESSGAWGQAQPVTGSREPVTTMSCPAAGSCPAGGTGYLSGSGYLTGPFGTAFLVTERGGRWGRARPVRGLGLLTSGRSAVDSVSCVKAGDCAVGGSFIDRSGHAQVFVADERGGVWSRARPIPGLAAINKGGQAGLTQVSCTMGPCGEGSGNRSPEYGRRSSGDLGVLRGGRLRRRRLVRQPQAANALRLPRRRAPRLLAHRNAGPPYGSAQHRP